MKTSDEKDFIEMLSSIADIYNRKLSAGTYGVYCAALKPYSLDQVREALNRHVTDSGAGKFFPIPAHIIDHMQSNDGRPTADEMWAMIPMSEDDSVCWTNEAVKAYFAASKLIGKDDIAARMAFKGAYDQAIKESRVKCIPVEWSVSLGADQAGREKVVMAALSRSRITLDRARLLLPELDVEQLQMAIKSDEQKKLT